MRKPGTAMRNCFFFVITVMLAAAGAGSIACSDDNDASSPLQPSPLATPPAGTGPRGLAGGSPTAPPAGPAAGAGDVPGLARVAPLPQGFNAYDARIEYRDGEVTLTFVPVDMPKMPDAAREYRNRAVTVWQCPVEPHHVTQRCGEPVFRDSFAFSGSPSRTFPLPDCAGWLVVEAAELSDDFYDGWRNAPLSCRQDEEGRTVADVDTGGGGAGWEDSRFDPPVRGSRRPSAQSVVDAAIVAAGGLKPNRDPVSVAVRELFAGTEGTTGAEYTATSSDETVVTVEVTDNPQVVLTPVAPGTATITITFLRTKARVEFDVTVTPPPPPRKWPIDVAIPSIPGSRLVIQRPGSDGWSSGSCRFGDTEPVWNTAWNHPNRRDPRGPTCVVHVKSAEVRNREYRFWYATTGNHVVGAPNDPFCQGLNPSGNLNSEGRPGTPNPLNPPSSNPPYSQARWVCQTRDWSPGTGYAPGRIRNVSFDTAARQLTFQINFFGAETTRGRPVFIEFELRNYPGVGQWSSQIRAVSEDFVYQSFPD